MFRTFVLFLALMTSPISAATVVVAKVGEAMDVDPAVLIEIPVEITPGLANHVRIKPATTPNRKYEQRGKDGTLQKQFLVFNSGLQKQEFSVEVFTYGQVDGQPFFDIQESTIRCKGLDNLPPNPPSPTPPIPPSPIDPSTIPEGYGGLTKFVFTEGIKINPDVLRQSGRAILKAYKTSMDATSAAIAAGVRVDMPGIVSGLKRDTDAALGSNVGAFGAYRKALDTKAQTVLGTNVETVAPQTYVSAMGAVYNGFAYVLQYHKVP